MIMTDVFEEVKSMLKANFPLLYLTTTEYNRVTQKLRTLCFGLDIKFNTWDAVDGLMTHKKDSSNRLVGCEPHEANSETMDSFSLFEYIRHALLEQNDRVPEVFVMEDCHKNFDQAKYPEELRKLSGEMKGYNKHIIFVGPFTKLPVEAEKYITILNVDLPNRDDLRIRLHYVAGKDYSISPDLEKFILDSALGLTDTEADLAFRLAKEKVGLNNKECIKIIANEKEQIIKKSGILDYIPVNMSLQDTVGGLENLKAWLLQRSKAFELKAKEFGLPEPKGILLLGVPTWMWQEPDGKMYCVRMETATSEVGYRQSIPSRSGKQ